MANLFPDPDTMIGSDKTDKTTGEHAADVSKTVSETAGTSNDAGISWWHVILSIISLLIVVTLAKLAWASRKRKQADQSRTVLD